MSSPKIKRKPAPLDKLAEASLEKPGMYLIALRAHLNRGKTMIGEVIHSVADAFPKSAKVRTFEEV